MIAGDVWQYLPKEWHDLVLAFTRWGTGRPIPQEYRPREEESREIRVIYTVGGNDLLN